MLKRLTVRNYILIDQLDIGFDRGLSIITGETGAGKSIVLGALSLLLGQRGEAGMLLDKQKKCISEGAFDIASYGLESFFHEHELDYESETIIRREISPDGKSRAFINDSPVNLTVLKDLASRLIDIHSQHENLLLGTSRFQLNVLDAFAGNTKERMAYKDAFSEHSRLSIELKKLEEQANSGRAELDYIRFQLDEFATLVLKTGEQESLELEQSRLENAGEILTQLGRVSGELSEGEQPLINRLQLVQQQVNALKKFDPDFQSISERLVSALIELKDVASELESISEKFLADPSRLEQVNDRLSAIYHLHKKHRTSTIDELKSIEFGLRDRLDCLDNLDDSVAAIRKQIELAYRALQESGELLRKTRTKAIPKLEKEINKQLAELAMPQAVLRIALIEAGEGHFLADGMEQVQFLFSANKGGDFKELSKAASGGEMARLMLCIKSILARTVSMPTLILDEIDTGISGETAARVGQILQQMAGEHQVITITHLPQIASKGNAHYLVFKETLKSGTRSTLLRLGEEERIKEVARMLSGEKLTEAAMDNARVLLGY